MFLPKSASALLRKVGGIFSEGIIWLIDRHLESVDKAVAKKLEKERLRIMNPQLEDEKLYNRLKGILQERGLHSAQMALDIYDAHYIRTGKVHPVILAGLQAQEKSIKVA